MKKIFFTFLIFTTGFIMADDKSSLDRAIEKLVNGSHFIYESKKVVTKDNKEVVKEILFNPLDNPNFTLITINGEKPSSKEIKTFKKDMKNEKGGNSIIYGFLGETYKKIYDDGKILKYEYITKESFIEGKEFLLNGEIVIDRETDEIVNITLRNPEEYSVMGAKLNSVYMYFTFMRYDFDNIVIRSVYFNLKGKMVMKEFTQSSETNNYNFRLVGK